MQKKKKFKCFRGKIDAKTETKNLEEKLKELESSLSVQDRPNAQHTLSAKKPKDA